MKKKLVKLHKSMRKEIKEKWNRVLPFHEEFTNRWEKAEYLGFGKGTSVYDSSIIMGEVKIGKYVWIGPYTLLDGTGGDLKIGNYCSISAGTQIYTHDTVNYCMTGGKLDREMESTTIGSYCYIGPMCIVSKGVTIGKHCIIGANSFVNKSFGNNSILAGNPARIIGHVIIAKENKVILHYIK